MMQARAAAGNAQQAPTLIFKNASNSTAGTLITTTPVSVAKANSQVNFQNFYLNLKLTNFILVAAKHCCIAE